MSRPASPVAMMLEHGVQPPSPAIAAILCASYGIPATAAQRVLWPSLSEMQWPDHPVHTIIGCIGRRGLKTSGIAAWVVTYEALFGGHEQYATGRIYFVIVAPMQRQARESVRGVLSALDACGVEYTVRDPGGVTEIVLAGGGCERVIAVFTASDVALRGYAIATLVLDEAAYLPSETHLASTDKEILNAARPGMAQFPNGKVVIVSTPGPAQGLFCDYVNTPPKGALLVRCPTWTANPRISREKCLELSAGDDRLFRQEFEASRFGATGESFFDEDLLRRCEEPPQPPIRYEHNQAAIGIDLALVRDATAICRARCTYVEIPNAAPIAHVFVDHCEQHRGSPKAPLALPFIVERLAGIWARSGKPRVQHDMHIGPEFQRQCSERGIKTEQVSVTNDSQAERAAAVAELVRGGRLHICCDNGRELVNQLAALKITQLSGGKVRIEGKRDDAADAGLIAIFKAASGTLTPSGGGVEYELHRPQWQPGIGLVGQFERRFYRKLPGGEREYITPPQNTPEWRRYVQTCLEQGQSSAQIEAWLEKNPDSDPRKKAEEYMSRINRPVW